MLWKGRWGGVYAVNRMGIGSLALGTEGIVQVLGMEIDESRM